ncbi:MAG: hypothetical protein IPP25_08390 [Saprospiraceae bacterium]|nr:hypothetical protein [Candidatus Opimibacter skivensis]
MLERLVALKIDQKYPDSGKITFQGIGADPAMATSLIIGKSLILFY